MPTYGRHFSSSRYGSRSHSRTKRGWFCLVPSKLIPESSPGLTTVGPWGIHNAQPQPFGVIPGSTRRWPQPASVATQCTPAHCPRTVRQQRWSPSVGHCWRQRAVALSVNYVQQHPQGESTSPTTVCGAELLIVAPRQRSASRRHNVRGWQWAHKAGPCHCRHLVAPTARRTHQCSNKRTAAHKTKFAPYTVQLRARKTDAAQPSLPTLGRHRARSHSRTKRAWLCFMPSKLAPRSVQYSILADHGVILGIQPQPSSVILGSTRRWTWPASVAARCVFAQRLHTARQRCWSQCAAASDPDYAPRCPKGESASITTLCGAQSTIVAPRHNARSGQWAHKGKPRRCQHGAAPTVRAAQRCPNRGTAAHKTGLAPHTFQLRARGTDTVLPQPPALGRHRAQSHSRTEKASYARCSPGQFPGQAALNHHCPSLATTTVTHRRPQQANVVQRQRTMPETRSIALAQRGIWTLCSPVRALHSLAMTRGWPGTPWYSAVVTRRKPRPSTARPMIPTIVGALPHQRTAQAPYSVTPRQQPCSPQGAAADVPPRHGTVLCPASRTGNRYTVPVTRCIPETLTKAPHRDACRVAPAVCALQRARHGARMTLDRHWKPVTAQSTTAHLAPFYTGEAAR
jgi:hypothetical protein